MNRPDVLFGLTGDVRSNSRALRQLRALTGLGYRVDVLCLGLPATASPLLPGVRLHVLERPRGRGPLFFTRVHRRFARAAARLPARVYHASDLYTLPAMARAARRHRGRLAYDARELYAHVASTAGRPWATSVWKHVEWRYIRRADAVFTVSDSIAEYLGRAYDIARPDVVYNAPPRRDVTPSGYLREATGMAPGDVLVLHQGQLRPHRGLQRLVEAMARVERAHLAFLGDGPLRQPLAGRAAQLGLQGRVHFVDPVPPDDLLPVTAGADVGVTLLEDTCLNHRFALPNKLFEYLMAGLPVLGSDLPEIGRVIASCRVGCTVDPADDEALVAALRRMTGDGDARRRWASRASCVFETFGWESASEVFTRRYQDLLSEKGAS